MPNTKSAEHRMRSNERRRVHNHSIKSRLKTLEKNYLALVTGAKKEEASEALRTISSAFDKAAKTGVLHANSAARKKSRLSAQFNRLK
jgi:small subunit ribosomal protein S20